MTNATTTERFKVVQTPGFQALNFRPGTIFAIITKAEEPSMIVSDPTTAETTLEDEGRTLRMPGLHKFYCIRDPKHEAGCGCGCDGAIIVTFLLPSEY